MLFDSWRCECCVVFQGTVVIKDGATDSETILIDVEKIGHSQQQISQITVDQTLFDVGHGTVFVLQLVNVHTLSVIRCQCQYYCCRLGFR